MLKTLIYRPWLHFIVLGGALFLLLRWIAPPPLPTVGPLPESQVDALRKQWFGATGRLPGDEQLAAMINAELDREILFREAVALDIYRYDPVVQQRLVRNMQFLGLGGDAPEDELFQEALRMELHLGDEVVKRRLIQVMEQLLLMERPPREVTAEDVGAAWVARREELRRPARYSIEQVFISRERAPELAGLEQRMRAGELTLEQARELGSPFLPGYRFAAQSPAQLARNFGAAFVMNFEAEQPRVDAWLGPIESTYGFHLVWVEAIEPARDARLEEVESQLRRDLQLEYRRQALEQAIAERRSHYEVIL